MFMVFIVANKIVLVYSLSFSHSRWNTLMELVAKLTAFLTLSGLSAPLETIFTYFGAMMGTSNTSIWSQRGMQTDWGSARYISGDVCFSPPPHVLCIYFSAFTKELIVYISHLL
jgi:hypothetical protein